MPSMNLLSKIFKSKAGDLTLPTSPSARFIYLDELKREAIFEGHSKLVLPIWSRQRLAEVLKAGSPTNGWEFWGFGAWLGDLKMVIRNDQKLGI
jgi:hypothetical protein